MTESVRHRILHNMVEVFRAVDTPTYPIKFSTVQLGPLSDHDHRKRFAIGIVPGPERYTASYPYTERLLQVAIEFRITVNQNDPYPGDMAEQVLTVLERVVIDNNTWGDLALKTDLENNELDMTTYADRSVMGVLWVVVHYRHGVSDPRNPNPEY